MARQGRWMSEDRRYRDDDNRDWRSAGDDWRRASSYRGPRHQDEGGWSDFDRGRDEVGDDISEEVRRRDVSGYGGANRDYGRSDRRDDWRADYGSGGSDRFGAGRPGGTFGPGTYESNRGSSYYDRDVEWSYGGSNRAGWGRPEDRWSADRGDWSGRRGDERGFLERAGDEVASWFGDRDAERRRYEDQHRGKGPKGYMRSDERMREDINDRLTDDPLIDASDVEVAVSRAEVTLTGFVRDRGQRRRAEDVAERVSGVSHVQNNIRVTSAGEAVAGNTIGDTAFGRDTSTGTLTGSSQSGGSPTAGALGSSATDQRRKPSI